MDRRKFIETGLIASVGATILPSAARGISTSSSGQYFHIPAASIKAPKVQVPLGKRTPFGWDTFVVPPAGKSGRVTILFGKTDIQFSEMRFRLCSVMDIREEIAINVYSRATKLLIGSFDIRYPHILQPFELLIDSSHHADILRKGVSLQMVKGTVPVWFLSHHAPDDLNNEALRPHLLLSNGKGDKDRFLKNFGSLNSIQQFGWMEGCVLDGLFDMFRKTGDHLYLSTINQHLNLFFDNDKKLDYEDPRSNRVYDNIYGIECPLPIAVIAKLEPRHPVLQQLADYCFVNKTDDGLIGGGHITTEGCYTLAYPMAETAVALVNPELAELAIKQILLRHKYLFLDGHIHQRGTREGHAGYTSWARGVAWYLLGMARTLISLEKLNGFSDLEGVAEMRTLFEEGVKWALKYQQLNGLWYAFLREALTGTDTSGSAGIAAAMALGEKHGFLSFSVRENTEMACNELFRHLTPDGFVTGAVQSNKAGEELQRSGYRVISQYSSGLLAQLVAAL
jgi:unsaturated rhamnogalacturonyl hydrolase